MLVDAEQAMPLAFRPVGQTELQRWLADLSAKDGVPPLTREPPAEPGRPARAPASPLAAQAEARRRPLKAPVKAPVVDGQESGLVLDMADAEEVSGGAPPPPPRATAAPPPPPPTEVMLEPGRFEWAEPWYRRRAVRMTGVAAAFLLLAALSAKALVRGGHRAGEPDHTANAEGAPAP